MVPQLQPQLGSPLPQLRSSGDMSSAMGANNLDDPSCGWIKNLSYIKPRGPLAEEPNYSIAPRHPPHLEYVTAIESACQKLNQQDAEELRTDINGVLRSSHPQT